VVLTAAPNAKPNAANVRVTGTAKVKRADGREETIVRDSRTIAEEYHNGGRELVLVATQVVAVTKQSTLVVTPSTTMAQLPPGGSVRIDFDVKRGADLPANLTLGFGHVITGTTGPKLGGDPFPPTITVDQGKSKLRLAPNETKGWITLSAAPSAPPMADVPFALMASAGTDGRMLVMYSTPAIYLTVPKIAK
jgi:hypothetical protein